MNEREKFPENKAGFWQSLIENSVKKSVMTDADDVIRRYNLNTRLNYEELIIFTKYFASYRALSDPNYSETLDLDNEVSSEIAGKTPIFGKIISLNSIIADSIRAASSHFRKEGNVLAEKYEVSRLKPDGKQIKPCTLLRVANMLNLHIINNEDPKKKEQSIICYLDRELPISGK